MSVSLPTVDVASVEVAPGRWQHHTRCRACQWWDTTTDRDAAIREAQEHECNLDEVAL